MTRRSFGQVRKLPSGRYQARFRREGVWHTARAADGGPRTFSTRRQAERWLDRTEDEISAGTWRPFDRPGPAVSVPTLREYAEGWLATRDLEQTTRDHYGQVLRDHAYPALGDVPLNEITPAMVRTWHASVGKADPRAKLKRHRRDRPTARAHAYGVLRTIMKQAVDDDVLAANPCRIRGGGQAKRSVKIQPASLAELEALVAAMPDHLRVMVLLASWCALRFGELAELRRSDLDLTNGVIHVRRGVVRTSVGRQVKGPKSDAGKRSVSIPSHLMPAVKDHLREHAQPGRDGLVFPARNGSQLQPATLYRSWYPAREAAGRPDLRFHDLRHTGAVLAAQSGATLAELMYRLGHSTPGAAMRYQHASAERDRILADKLAELATGNVVPIGAAKGKRAKGGKRGTA